MNLVIILSTLLGFLLLCEAKTYENYKVYSVVPKNEKHVQMLIDLEINDLSYDFWSDVTSVGHDVRIMVPPQKEREFLSYINNVEMDPVLRIKNLQDLINAQRIPSQVTARSSLGNFTWTAYHTLEEIHAWIDELEDMYPEFVTPVTIGQSYEGRDIKGVIIDLRPNQRGDNPLIGMIEGGIHAREWISPATVTWIIKEFLTSTDEDVRSTAEAFVWHIFPVVNPDGYVYTFTNDRMWRKNRNPANSGNCTGASNDLSNGIDLNRNFNFVWMSVGASQNPCSQTYAGPSASSELETIAISNYVQTLRADGNLIYYIAFHSYSQMVLVPYSHVSGINVLEAENYGDMYEAAIRGAARLTETHGTNYTVGTSMDILYPTSGGSFDWVKGVANVPIVYLLELRDLGQYGFLLPPEQIIPNNEEVMEFIKEMDRTTRALGYYSYEYGSGSNVLASVFGVIFSLCLLIVVQ